MRRHIRKSPSVISRSISGGALTLFSSHNSLARGGKFIGGSCPDRYCLRESKDGLQDLGPVSFGQPPRYKI